VRMIRAMVMAVRVMGNKKSKGGRAMAMATRVMGERMAAVTKRAIAMVTRKAGKEEGNDKGSKSNGDGNKEGNGKEDSNDKS
jgi:hypothetical protein